MNSNHHAFAKHPLYTVSTQSSQEESKGVQKFLPGLGNTIDHQRTAKPNAVKRAVGVKDGGHSRYRVLAKNSL